MAKEATVTKRAHKASYAKDKRKGGYLIRIAGPHANEFAGREVPVSMKDGGEQPETVLAVIWSGIDKETGDNVALYTFQAKPREKHEVTF